MSDVVSNVNNNQFSEAKTAQRNLLERHEKAGKSSDYKDGQALSDNTNECKAVSRTGAHTDGEKLYALISLVDQAQDARQEMYGVCGDQVAGYAKEAVAQNIASSSREVSHEDVVDAEGRPDPSKVLKLFSNLSDAVKESVAMGDTTYQVRKGNLDSVNLEGLPESAKQAYQRKLEAKSKQLEISMDPKKPDSSD